MIRIKRVYDREESAEGKRVLVDRLWPRGVSRAGLRLDAWQKEVAPSRELREWFGHEPARWEEFRKRYFAELDANQAAWEPLAEMARRDDVTLLYGARDREHNNAVALKEYLESRLRDEPGRSGAERNP